MSKHYPEAATIASLFNNERRGVSWGKQGIEFAHQNLLVAAKDIPEGEEYAELRRAVYRALDKLRQARGAMTAAYDAMIEAKLIAERSEAVYLQNPRLKERYSGGQNGAQMVRGARKERDRREAEYSEKERWKREMERQRFLSGEGRGEGMRDDLD